MTFVGNVRIAIRLPQDCWRSKHSLVSSPVSDETEVNACDPGAVVRGVPGGGHGLSGEPEVPVYAAMREPDFTTNGSSRYATHRTPTTGSAFATGLSERHAQPEHGESPLHQPNHQPIRTDPRRPNHPGSTACHFRDGPRRTPQPPVAPSHSQYLPGPPPPPNTLDGVTPAALGTGGVQVDCEVLRGIFHRGAECH